MNEIIAQQLEELAQNLQDDLDQITRIIEALR